MSGSKERVAQLRPFMPADQRAIVDSTAKLLGISEGAAIALGLCREVLRDYCPPDETIKVLGALLGLESRKRSPTEAPR